MPSCRTDSPLSPDITTIVPEYWTAAIHWVHDATCFERCEYVVEWDTFSAATEAMTIHIDRLKPGEQYKVDVKAKCTTGTPSQEQRLSTRSTREFKTKGISPRTPFAITCQSPLSATVHTCGDFN